MPERHATGAASTLPDLPPARDADSAGQGAGGTNAALAAASAAIGRLDQALDNHPLQTAFLYRVRLEAVRRQAAVDGQAIEPWQLAAILEGLRLRMAGPRIIDRGAIFEAARYALSLHQWLVEPDFDQEGDIQQAQRLLIEHARTATPLLAAAYGMHAWLSQQGSGISHQASGESDGRDDGSGGSGSTGAGAGIRPGVPPGQARPAMRAALIRFWVQQRVLQVPVPLTGAAALRADTPWERSVWVPAFLHAVAGEADDARQLLLELERAWFAARHGVARRRRNSRAAAAIDCLAAAPLLSATTLAQSLGMAIKNAAALLDDFVRAGIAVEVTQRAARRLYGLAGLTPLRHEVAPARRPQPGRGRGRPKLLPTEELPAPALLPIPDSPLRPVTPIERRDFDYSDLEQWMAQADQAIRHTRRVLEQTAHARAPQESPSDSADQSSVVREETEGSRRTMPASSATADRQYRAGGIVAPVPNGC